MHTVPTRVTRTRTRKAEPQSKNEEPAADMPVEEQRELLPAEEMAPAKKELSVKGPFATRTHQLALLTTTSLNQMVFQDNKNGKIITTDREGYPWPRKLDSKQLVFNSTPEDLRKQRTRTKFVIGEVVYCLRPMSRSRKVYAARVVGFDHRGVLLDVLGATGESKFGRNRTREDGTIIYPYSYCFKEASFLQQYLDTLRDDFAKSQTDFRHLLEQTRK